VDRQGACSRSPSLWKADNTDTIASSSSPPTFTSGPSVRSIAERMLAEFELGDEPDLAAILAQPDEDGTHAVAVALHQRVQHECAADPVRTRAFFEDCLKGLARESRRTTRVDVSEIVSRLRAEQAEHAQEKGVARIPRLGS
jgi:hypothetical protein